MARNRKKMSPYEVIGKTRSKSSYGKISKKLPPEKSERTEKDRAESVLPAPGKVIHWPRKPKIVQFNAGRIEISLPYPLAIAVLLGIILLFLVALWIGEIGYLNSERAANSTGKVLKGRQKAVTGGMSGSDLEEKNLTDLRETETSALTGNNRIVIQTYHSRADLELVQYHFAQGNIGTEIRKIGDTFYLVSKDKYENPGREGTDGYAAKQKIIEWGARYKAPKDYETFAPNLFSDAYGKKFED
ncbi:MAG: hypothetical protein FVQ85_06795 [Planctomycetes bacterium]|nr:hypothetical protein [Planctomycetota bacterium]